MIFIDIKYVFNLIFGIDILIDLKQIFPMKPSEFKIFISVKIYDEKTEEIIAFGKAHSFQTIKDIESKF